MFIRARTLVLAACGLTPVLLLVGPTACSSGSSHASAERVLSRGQLIGGPDALGDLGDIKLSNGKVRFIVQGITKDSNYSRGWGVYGGSVIDADLVRPDTATGNTPNGTDRFGELFPAYFLEAIEPAAVEVGNDGADGRAATVVVTGRARPFLSTAKNLLDIAVAPSDEMVVTTTYSLGPDDQFLTITSELVDETRDRTFPAAALPAGLDLAIPFGTVLLFGNKNQVFLPKTGFDLRYGLEDAYREPPRLPVLPGLVTDLLATRGKEVSYGFVSAPPEKDAWSYAFRNRANLGPATKTTDMVVPFYASSFTGVFSAQPPDALKRGEVFRYQSYFIVGNGDVGSIRDVEFKIRGDRTGRFTALVREAGTNAVVPGASLIVLDSQGRPYSQYEPNADGRVAGTLPPGTYSAVVVCDHRDSSSPVAFTVAEGAAVEVSTTVEGKPTRTLEIAPNARLNVRITEADGPSAGRPIPAKVTLMGVAPWNTAVAGKPPRKFLYDLAKGERMRPTDGVTDTEERATRRFVERVMLAEADGRASGEVRPGTYQLLVSRGPEYDAVRVGEITFEPGKVYDREVSLRHLVSTPGWVSADFHVHSANSIDSGISLNDRVRTYAAEGVEYLAATDHNVVSQLAPNVQALGLEEFLKTTVGVEMTTLEMGHFNAFPLRYDPVSATHGAFPWIDLPPRDLFRRLRCLGEDPAQTIVQINHPRDTILGYFNQFNVSPETGLPRPGNPIASPTGPAFRLDQFSWGYDAMEVFNGKRQEQLRTYRMPDVKPLGSPELPINPGDIVRLPCPTSKPDCDYAKQEVAHPGVIEDWFKLLNMAGTAQNLGSSDATREVIAPVTGTGNSDSHGLYFEEAGYPRNYLYVGKDDPRTVVDSDVTRAVRKHKVVFTNGPFIEVIADGSGAGQQRQSPIGGLLAPIGDTVRLNVRVAASAWISVERLLVYVNGDLVRKVDIDDVRNTSERCCTATIDVRMPKDGWIVVAAEGDDSMFPFVTPLEEAPLAISDALSAIAGPLGFGEDGLGPLAPEETHVVTPFAMTNPIWIDRDGGPNNAPDGVSYGRGRDVEPAAPSCDDTTARSDALVVAGAPAAAPEQAGARKRQATDLSRLIRNWGHGHSN